MLQEKLCVERSSLKTPGRHKWLICRAGDESVALLSPEKDNTCWPERRPLIVLDGKSDSKVAFLFFLSSWGWTLEPIERVFRGRSRQLMEFLRG